VASRCGELDDGEGQAGMTLEDARKDRAATAPDRTPLSRVLLAARSVLSPALRILPCRRVAVCRLNGGPSASAAAQNGLYSGWSCRRRATEYSVIRTAAATGEQATYSLLSASTEQAALDVVPQVSWAGIRFAFVLNRAIAAPP
jgi:hypothetical protein